MEPIEYTLEALAVGAHPDDIEICCGGLLALLAEQGHRTGALDLTEGELGTKGTVEERRKEAAAAAKILGLSYRENLGFPDGDVGDRGSSTNPLSRSDQLIKVVAKLRTVRPEILIIPYWEERHPDHVATSELLKEAVFLANLEKWNAHLPDEVLPKIRYQPRQLLFYEMRFTFIPTFFADISSVFEKKYKAVECYISQVTLPGQAEVAGKETLIGSPMTLPTLRNRDQHYGAKIGTMAAEAFLSFSPVMIRRPVEFFRENQERINHFYTMR